MEPRGADLRDSVRDAYSRAASNPSQRHPFPVGKEFAGSLGYPAEILDRMPAASVEAVAGVSNVSVCADLPAGGSVVDLGCGSGLDSLSAAERAGVNGRVAGVDFSSAMLERARCSLSQTGLSNLIFLQAAAERLPFGDASVDHVLVNGIFNLNPYRDQIFGELARIVKPGGRVFGAELVLRAPLEEEWRAGAANWFS